jgi:hypothetical protein
MGECNSTPRYLLKRNEKVSQANSLRDSTITRVQWTGGVAQRIERLLCKCLLWKREALNSNPSPTKESLEMDVHRGIAHYSQNVEPIQRFIKY